MDSVIDTAWTIHSLRDALVESALVREDEMTATVVEGVEPVLLVVMHEYGDLPIYVSGGPLQLVVSTLLWPCDEQKRPRGLQRVPAQGPEDRAAVEFRHHHRGRP
jgi:uncharacterized protein YjfI (DUF2170 family)